MKTIKALQSIVVSKHTTKHTLPDPETELVSIGYVSKAHGIRGELTLVLTAQSEELVQGVLFLRPKNGGLARPFTVARVRKHHGTLLISFEGVCTRNDAELLRSHTVFITKDRLPALDEDEVYLDDLPGLHVIVVEGDSERELGIINSVSAPAGQILWSILAPDGKEILFPAVEQFIIALDLEAGAARIAPPPGLLDLYLRD